jgi:hypothetical protein
MWLFDRTNLSGNEICLVDPGVADLSTYLRVRTPTSWISWKGAIRSFYGGRQNSMFRFSGSDVGFENFPPFSKNLTVDSDVQKTYELTLLPGL